MQSAKRAINLRAIRRLSTVNPEKRALSSCRSEVPRVSPAPVRPGIVRNAGLVPPVCTDHPWGFAAVVPV